MLHITPHGHFLDQQVNLLTGLQAIILNRYSKLFFTLKAHYRDADVFFLRIFLLPDDERTERGYSGPCD